MDVVILKIVFAGMAFAIVILSILINSIESRLPVSIVQSFRYGKFSSKRKHFLVTYLEVPKRWFKHFYIFAAVWATLGFLLILSTIVFKLPVPEIIYNFLDFFASSNRRTSYNATATLIAVTCMLVQCWRRFYETHYLSVFSKSTINISHYAIGYIHYFGCITAILAEAPSPFTTPSMDFNSYISMSDINIKLIIGSSVFIWAFKEQYTTNKTLAKLRVNEKGQVVTYEHKIPTGGLFDKISCPHLFCEALMYLAIYIILWGSQIWPYVVFWVLSNQCETAMLNHWWYQSTFKLYPKKRRAFIPYIL
ncbi:polyprenol reductase [Daktulosphaira vitifoliae]|uniref:polyprenol reductase n=1 Tax=Daktulosphaira vitifoliae TaxID=58002 RepID=UPI0021AA44A2|nr:polyprenol reductase [Daktulosphaira vitifoliae]